MQSLSTSTAATSENGSLDTHVDTHDVKATTANDIHKASAKEMDKEVDNGVENQHIGERKGNESVMSNRTIDEESDTPKPGEILKNELQSSSTSATAVGVAHVEENKNDKGNVESAKQMADNRTSTSSTETDITEDDDDEGGNKSDNKKSEQDDIKASNTLKEKQTNGEVQDEIAPSGEEDDKVSDELHSRKLYDNERKMSVRSSHAIDTLAVFEEQVAEFEEYVLSDAMSDESLQACDNDELLALKNRLEQMTGEAEKLQFTGIDSVQTVDLESGKAIAKDKRKELNKRIEVVSEKIVSLCKSIAEIIKSREGIISSLRMSISSWNVGNAVPSEEEFKYWLPNPEENYDLVVVGLQECEYELTQDMKNLVDSAKSKFKSDRKILKMQASNINALTEQPTMADVSDDITNNTTSPATTASTAMTTPEGASPSGNTPPQQSTRKIQNRLGSVAKAMEKRTKKAITSNVGMHVAGLIANYLGQDYFLVSESELMQMRLFMFSKTEHMARITNIEVASEATGVGGVVGNKGGLFISLDFQGVRLCFTSCHLAAHEEEKYLKNRNSNCDEILGSALRRIGTKLVPYSVDWHHMFFFGDLNYRIDPRIGGTFTFAGKTRASTEASIDDNKPKNQDASSLDGDGAAAAVGTDDGKGKKPKKYWPERDKVIEIIGTKDWDLLMKIDQLKDEQRHGRALYGFEEGKIDFEPTFKVARGKVICDYDDKRTPSYCDRVLWTRSPDRRDDSSIIQHLYAACPNVTTSDHKPVRAGFVLDLKNKLPPLLPIPKADTQSKAGLLIKITELEVRNLESADVDGFADPYIIMHSSALFPPGSDGANPSKGACKTKVLMHRLDAKWVGSSYVMRCDPSITLPEHLNNRHLVLSVWDFDRLSADDVMGSAVISFNNLFQKQHGKKETPSNNPWGKSYRFDEPVIRSSHVSGRVLGKIEFLLPSSEEKTVEGKHFNGFCSANSQYCSKCSVM